MLVVLNRVMGFGGKDEVGRDQLRALVQQLVERVLGIGGWLSEENGTCRILDVLTRPCDGFTVRLHRQLLQISRETVQVLVKGRNEVRLRAEKVRVPHAQETANDGDVLLQWGLLKVLVHGVGACEELVEVVEANVKSNA